MLNPIDWRHTELHWHTGVHSSTPPQVFLLSLSAGAITLLYSSLAWSPERLTHTPKHTAQSDSRDPVVRHGGAGAHPQQLTWSSLDGELWCAGWRNCGLNVLLYTDWTAQQSNFTMEFGRVWSRYQRTLLITMMMFKLGKVSTRCLYCYYSNGNTWHIAYTFMSLITVTTFRKFQGKKKNSSQFHPQL